MIQGLIVAGAALLLAAGLIAPLGARVHPAHRARLLSGALVIGLFLVETGLILWSLPVVVDRLGLTELSELCLRIVGGGVPGGALGGFASGMAAIWLGVAACRGGWVVLEAQRALRIESTMWRWEEAESFDVFVVPSPKRMAYTVGIRRPQVVLSSAVFAELDPELVDVIRAHEAAHACHRHHRFLVVAAAVEAAVGWLNPVESAVSWIRLSLERWADEDASAFAPGGRTDVRRALLLACFGDEIAEAASFGEPEMASARISALAGPPPRSFPPVLGFAYTAFGAVSLIAAISVTWATRMSFLAIINPGQCFVS